MSVDGDLDYALARIAARRARRPGPVAWRGLESSRTLAAALAAAREAGLGGWLAGLDARADPHRIEAVLREGWRHEVGLLSHWMPRRWRAALAACADGVELPALRAGRAGGTLDRLRATLPRGHQTVDAAWLALLADRLREAGADGDPAFARLGRILATHRTRFAALPPGNGWPQRAELEASLLAFLHAGAPGAATAFGWVALRALEFERLRGLLLPHAAREAAA